ncbi:MAG: glycosyltransferase family 4 protein [Candidatus Omnitrophica bacterium]|nr:glycosyltransferase family 4 protein [Candidatus Omnitrophota bacterium]
MHILSLNYEFPPLGGGGGYVTKAINERLAKKGFKVDLVTTHYSGLKYEEVLNGARIFRVKSIRKKQATCETPEMLSFVLSAIPFVLDLTKKNKYDVIHCHFAIPTGIVAYTVSKLRGLNYVVTAHGSDVPGHNPHRFTLEHKFTKPLLNMIMKRAKTVVTPSQNLRDSIHRKICADLPIKIIPNGIESDMFSLEKQRNNWILMSGRLLELKGFQYVLAALKDTPLFDWEIHLAGDGPYREKLEALAKEVNTKIVFHGWLPKGSEELKDLYEHSKIFILPSVVENAPISLLEAMNAELAVITTKKTGCQEIAGDSALLVDPHDVDGIKDAILKLAGDENLIKNYGEKARKHSIERFSWNSIVDNYLNVYKEACKI